VTISARPAYSISFGSQTTVGTTQLLEELGISYATLHSRIRKCGFPKPVTRGYNGAQALYDVGEVLAWCKRNNFVVAIPLS
jgi:predicted DNA-binding transcriptional regulator AlpA